MQMTLAELRANHRLLIEVASEIERIFSSETTLEDTKEEIRQVLSACEYRIRTAINSVENSDVD